MAFTFFQLSICSSVASGIFSRICFTPSSGKRVKSLRMRPIIWLSESMVTAFALRTFDGNFLISCEAWVNSPLFISWSTLARQLVASVAACALINPANATKAIIVFFNIVPLGLFLYSKN